MKAKIIWFTGLSGTGKSTISNYLNTYLKKKRYKVLQIDGDIFRSNKKYKNNFSKKKIKFNNYQIIKYTKKNIKKYNFILVSVISPFKSTRAFAKKIFGRNYFEVYVYCAHKTLKKRDTKGLYKLADKKIIKNLVGYKSNIKYEKSKYKKIKINTDIMNLSYSKKKIMKLINQ